MEDRERSRRRSQARPHQDRIIEVVRLFLSQREGREIEIAGYPDVDGSGPVLTRRCDALLRAPGWARAVEHTSLDSFGDQRGVAARFHRVIAPLEARLTGRVDHYIELAVDPKAIATGADWTAWTEAIGEAVVAAVPAMPIDEWGTLRVPGVPFEIGVRTEENAGIGEVRVIQMAPADLEGERAEVIREAISGKVGVLAPYKAHGYRTVLVLECDDLMLGSRRRIADAFRPLAAACGTAIDDVYLVETRTSPWAVSWLKLGDLVTLHPEPVWPTAPGWPFRLR